MENKKYTDFDHKSSRRENVMHISDKYYTYPESSIHLCTMSNDENLCMFCILIEFFSMSNIYHLSGSTDFNRSSSKLRN